MDIDIYLYIHMVCNYVSGGRVFKAQKNLLYEVFGLVELRGTFGISSQFAYRDVYTWEFKGLPSGDIGMLKEVAPLKSKVRVYVLET